MVKTLQEAEGYLAELVEQARRGEEVLISVDGEVQARLLAVQRSIEESAAEFDGGKWWARLQELHRKYPVTGRPMQELLDEVREERL